jgi:hypothetical protein
MGYKTRGNIALSGVYKSSEWLIFGVFTVLSILSAVSLFILFLLLAESFRGRDTYFLELFKAWTTTVW